MRESAQLVSKTLGMLAPLLVPGAIPLELDKKAEDTSSSQLKILPSAKVHISL